MKTINLIIFTLLTLVVFIMSCEPCPEEGQHWGQKELFPISKTYVPNIADKILVYKDSLGNEIRFLASDTTTIFEETFLASSCLMMWVNSTSDYIDLEVTSWNLQAMDTVFSEINFTIKPHFYDVTQDSLYNIDTTNIFVDLLQIVISNANPNSYSSNSFAITNRGNDVDIYNTQRVIADTTIMGKDFEDVIEFTTVEPNVIFYHKEKGILLLKDENQKYWVLDRIE